MINCTMHYLWFGGISLLTVEVMLWAYTLNRHAVWLHDSDKVEKKTCFKDAWPRIYMASVMACGLSLICFFWEVSLIYHVFIHDIPHSTYMPWIIAGIQLSHIHFFAIIARCSCLDVSEWPWLSKQISKLLAKF